MPIADVNGIRLCYETTGSPDNPPLLLVFGLGSQLTSWTDDFISGLADRGHYVIRFDNRDAGLSTHFDGVEVDVLGAMVAAQSGQPVPPAPYTLSDMSDDGFALLDHLGIHAAHIVGASMGGMIVQTMATERPSRVLSLTSIMSTTGEVDFFVSSPEAQAALLSAPPTTVAEAMAQAVASWSVWSSKKYFDTVDAEQRAKRDYERMNYPEGVARQMMAIFSSGDKRVEALRTLDVPTLVIHGRDDTLIEPIGGSRTAELVPGATYMLLSDMGHDFPRPLWPTFYDAIGSHIARAGKNGRAERI